MRYEPEKQWFSDYFDGELTTDQKREVEALLAFSPVARRLLKDFATIRSTLQAFSVHRLNEDLSQKVLRAAEQGVLTGRDCQGVDNRRGGTDQESQATRITPLAPRWKPILLRVFQPRTLFWPMAAAAAAILIFITHPGGIQPPPNGGKGPVAMAPAKDKKSSEPGTIGAAKELERHKAGQNESAGRNEAPKPAMKDGVASPEPTKPDATTKPQMPSAGDSVVSNMSQAAPESNADFPAGPQVAEKLAQLAKPSGTVERVGVPDVANAHREPSGLAIDADNDRLMVVYCDVASDSSGGRVFDELLKRQHLRLKAVAREPQDPWAVLFRGFMTGALRVAEGSWGPALPEIKPVYVRVEGTPAEIEASVAEVKAHPDKFPYCSVRFGVLSSIHRESDSKAAAQAPESVRATKSNAPVTAEQPPVERATRNVVFVVRTVPSNLVASAAQAGPESPETRAAPSATATPAVPGK